MSLFWSSTAVVSKAGIFMSTILYLPVPTVSLYSTYCLETGVFILVNSHVFS